MKPKSITIVGAAETTNLGVIPDTSQIQLHADAALNAMADAGLKPADIDGIATAGETPVTVAHYLGLTPKWVDGTAVGGCSFMIHVRHAAAAIELGLCKTVLITHGESGRSGVGRTRNAVAPTSLAGQFEQPYGPMGPPTLFTIPVLRYMKTYGLSHETLATVSVVQREWAAKNPRATFKTPITVEDVLNSRMIAYPFRLLQCCLVTDGGGALILVSAERAKDFPQKPVYLLGTGESVETPMVSQMAGFHLLARVPRRRAHRLCRGRHHPQRRRPSDDLRRLCASADLRPRGSGLCAKGRGRSLYRRAQYRPRRQIAVEHQWWRPLLHAFRHVRHVRIAGERAPDARHRPGPNPRCQDLGLPWRSAACSPPLARSSCRTRPARNGSDCPSTPHP